MYDKKKGKAVPSGRLSRVFGLGTLATRIAGNVVSQGATQLLKGQRPALTDLLLTPTNIGRVTDKLATMRGAAMKLGQLISMDGGDFLPQELTDILARLRDDAEPMPKTQLIKVLNDSWGENWKNELTYFSFSPVAAASIGQVHKAITRDGTTLAVKVQYPGVRNSIDSDVDNVASLIGLTGLLPKSLDIAPLLKEAKIQLYQEADYQREASMLQTFATKLENDKDFIVPVLHKPLSCDRVLAMSFEQGEDIHVVTLLPQNERNHLMTALMRLFFRELFEFQLIQSDPNLANYRYHKATGKIVLLDFGASRPIPNEIAQGYRHLLRAAATENRDAMRRAALEIGLVSGDHTLQQQQIVSDIGMMACEAINQPTYHFGKSDLIARLHEQGMSLTNDKAFWHVPPADAIFIHRKLGGLFLLAKRLEAEIDLRDIASPWL